MKITNYEVFAPISGAMRFAFVSDLHDRPFEKVIESLKKIAPNAVLIGGDFTHDKNNYRRGLEFLKECASLFPTFCVSGNHELKCGLDLANEVAKTGAKCVDNSFSEFCGVKIGGLAASRKTPDLAWLETFAKESGFKILLCHRPEYYEKYVAGKGIDLTLSGHAHGGQWRFFGIGIFSSGQGIFPKYTHGKYDGGKLIVGSGLSNRTPVPRIFNPKEVLAIEIKPEK